MQESQTPRSPQPLAQGSPGENRTLSSVTQGKESPSSLIQEDFLKEGAIQLFLILSLSEGEAPGPGLLEVAETAGREPDLGP
jgi:hypothetical protein